MKKKMKVTNGYHVNGILINDLTLSTLEEIFGKKLIAFRLDDYYTNMIYYAFEKAGKFYTCWFSYKREETYEKKVDTKFQAVYKMYKAAHNGHEHEEGDNEKMTSTVYWDKEEIDFTYSFFIKGVDDQKNDTFKEEDMALDLHHPETAFAQVLSKKDIVDTLFDELADIAFFFSKGEIETIQTQYGTLGMELIVMKLRELTIRKA